MLQAQIPVQAPRAVLVDHEAGVLLLLLLLLGAHPATAPRRLGRLLEVPFALVATELAGHASVEIECSPNRLAELMLLAIEQDTDLISQSVGGDRRDVVTNNDGGS